ncbi:hypothetical protein BKA57DRAFT_445550 [Linnemannia elongata]|nr:hypothetical protein BKA57DRAFT_445550 [Linnemannia elongata]
MTHFRFLRVFVFFALNFVYLHQTTALLHLHRLGCPLCFYVPYGFFDIQRAEAGATICLRVDGGYIHGTYNIVNRKRHTAVLHPNENK